MSMQAVVLAKTCESATERGSFRGRCARARLFVLIGLAAIGAATMGLSTGILARETELRTAAAGPPATLATAEVNAKTVMNVTYEPGEASGWHLHPGIHVVDVISGLLTVYDEACQPHVYGPGDRYIGGRQPHLARNETATPVEMVVTTVDVDGAANSVTQLPTPAACSAS